MPGDTPLTTPAGEIVAIAILPEFHTPPAWASDKVIVLPRHREDGPVIIPATGRGRMVIIVVTVHPEPVVYEITAAPAETPVTTPVTVIVAIAVLPELQMPPLTESLKVT